MRLLSPLLLAATAASGSALSFTVNVSSPLHTVDHLYVNYNIDTGS